MAPPGPPLIPPLGGPEGSALLDEAAEEEDEEDEDDVSLSEPQAATVDNSATVASGATRVRRSLVMMVGAIRFGGPGQHARSMG
jgi:hypothetical protein